MLFVIYWFIVYVMLRTMQHVFMFVCTVFLLLYLFIVCLFLFPLCADGPVLEVAAMSICMSLLNPFITLRAVSWDIYTVIN